MKKTLTKFIATGLCLVLFGVMFIGNRIDVHAATIDIWNVKKGDVLHDGDVLSISTLNNYGYGVGILYFASEADFKSKKRLAVNYTQNAPWTHNISGDWIVINIYDSPSFDYGLEVIPYVAESTPTHSGCSHSCEWEVQSKATETTDGIMAYVCTKCGAITDYMQGGTGHTSAFATFNQKTIEKVNNANTGDTVSINTLLWTSFTQKTMEAIAARRDLNIELTYHLAGTTYTIVIPAGAEVPTDVPYAGFDGYLAGLYGKTEVQ